MINKNRGITIITLVITIIILLILAGISIATLTGNDGLINKAKKATTDYKKAEAEEEEALNKLLNGLEVKQEDGTEIDIKEVVSGIKEELINEIKKELSNQTSGEVNGEILDKIYPIGSIYMSTQISTVDEMEEKIGGKWESYGVGRTIVGAGSGHNAGETGGSSDAILTTENIPNHSHSIPALSGTTSTETASGEWVGMYTGSEPLKGVISGSTYVKDQRYFTCHTTPVPPYSEMLPRKYVLSYSHEHTVNTAASTSGSTRFRQFF